MRECYEFAYRLKLEKRDRDPWFPLSNCVAAEIVRGWQPALQVAAGSTVADVMIEDPLAKVIAQDLQGHLETLIELTREAQRGETDFYGLVAPVDASLLSSLHRQTFNAQTRAGIEGDYRQARRRGASAKQLDSVASQIEFLQVMAEKAVGMVPGDLAAELLELVTVLRAARRTV